MMLPETLHTNVKNTDTNKDVAEETMIIEKKDINGRRNHNRKN